MHLTSNATNKKVLNILYHRWLDTNTNEYAPPSNTNFLINVLEFLIALLIVYVFYQDW